MKNQQTGWSQVLHWNWLFLITPAKGTPLCMVVWAEWTRCTTIALQEQTLEGSETEEVPWSVNCLPATQWQTVETPLGWVNRKLCVFLWMFAGASLLDQGWKVQCRGTRSPQTSTSVFWRWRYWSHQWSLKDMTGHNNLNPTSLCARDCKLWGCEVGALAHALISEVTVSSSTLILWELLVSPTWEGTGMSHPLQCRSVEPFDLPTHERGLIHKTKTLYKCIKAMNLLGVLNSKTF